MPQDLENFEVPGQPITLVFHKDRAFFSERVTGNIWEYINGQAVLVKTLPTVKATGHYEAGALGIALDPDFENNNFMYCYFTHGPIIDNCRNEIMRFKVGTDEEEMIIDGIPGGQIHNGGIIAFGPDGKLYAGVGVRNDVMDKAQDMAYYGGKILRINSDGSIPEDNPFPGSPIYSFGHRNIFGLAFSPESGKLFITEEGPEKDDEINIIKAGGNYGWPNVTGMTDNPDYINPIASYTPTITPTQCCFADNHFYFGSYNDGKVHKLTINETEEKVMKDEIVFQGRPFGIIGVFYSPSKVFYVATANKIMRIEPQQMGENYE